MMPGKTCHSKQSYTQPEPHLLQEVLQDYSRAENGLIFTICKGQRSTCHLEGCCSRGTLTSFTPPFSRIKEKSPPPPRKKVFIFKILSV